MNILISGSCGVTSRAIARSLRLSEKFGSAKLVGTDVCENRYGIHEGLFDVTYRVPYVWESGYESLVEKICATESISVAVIIPELEVRHWASRKFPVPVMLPPPDFCELAVSKKRLYEALSETGLVPDFQIVDSKAILGGTQKIKAFPRWVREFDEGSSSGKGAYLVNDEQELEAWMTLNRDTQQLMVAEVLPGRNLACHLLYNQGELVKIATYERLKYFMSRVSMSGITGNICEGRLVNIPAALKVSTAAVAKLIEMTGETMHGIVAVDLKESSDGTPMVTEVNLRHVASTFSFARGGINLAETQVALALDPKAPTGDIEITFPPNNRIFRDIDGEPIWIRDFQEPEVGIAVGK